jgi:hypothetical protein
VNDGFVKPNVMFHIPREHSFRLSERRKFAADFADPNPALYRAIGRAVFFAYHLSGLRYLACRLVFFFSAEREMASRSFLEAQQD